MSPIYLGDWNNLSELAADFCDDRFQHDCASSFEASLGDLEILLSYYSCEGYEGDAFVLFRKDGKLYEVNVGHCSCSGLEGQWEPEETTVTSMRHRIEHGNLGTTWSGGEKFSIPLRAILDELEKNA